jgi:hypothetical protein
MKAEEHHLKLSYTLNPTTKGLKLELIVLQQPSQGRGQGDLVQIEDFCISSQSYPAIYESELDTLYVQGDDRSRDENIAVLESKMDVVQKYFMNVVQAVAVFNGQMLISEFQDLKPTGIIE